MDYMGLIDLASNKSFWRGVDYYKNENVLSWEKNDNEYIGVVKGSHNERYKVLVDKVHPKKSKCTCPFATGKRVICKHMLAVYFAAEPKELDDFLAEQERLEKEWEEEEEQRMIEHEQNLMNKAKSMKKADLVEELVLAWLRIEELEDNNYYY